MPMPIFGRREPPRPYAAPAAPAPTRSVESMQHNIETRAGGIEAKIHRADAELAGYKAEMARQRVGSTQHTMYKNRALRVLKQKKMYENQLRGTTNTMATFDQVQYAKEAVGDVKDTMAYMQEANKDMKKNMAKVDVDKMADMQDELEDMLQDTNEMTDILGRTYEVGEGMNEAELEAELDGIGEELNYDAGTVPSYLQPQAHPAVSSNQIPDQQLYGGPSHAK